MIIEELCKYYEFSNNLKIGFKWQEIGFVIVIDKNGNLRSVDDLRQKEGTGYKGKLYEVPEETQRTTNTKSYTLYDNLEYCIGIKQPKKELKEDKSKERNEAFIDSVKDLNNICNDINLGYLIKFLDNDPKSQFETYIQNCKQFKLEDFFGKSYSWITFRIEGIEVPIVVDLLQNTNYTNYFKDKIINSNTKDKSEYTYFVDDIENRSCKNHFPIKIGKPSPFCSLNQESFYSYNKENPPTNQETVYKYCAALNQLLSSDKNKVSFNDYTIVFWSDVTSYEDPFAKLFSINYQDPNQVMEIKSLFESVYKSKSSISDTSKYFYILGFKPGYRFSIKFWNKLNIYDLSKHITQHFNDLSIDSKFELNYSIINCLDSVFKKEESKPNNLFGNIADSIYNGTMYPSSFLSSLRRRHELEKIKDETHESSKRSNIRAALIKAYYNRRNRIYNENNRELTMALDKDNINIGYCIGRLFAVLVIAQSKTDYKSYIKSYKNVLNNPTSLPDVMNDYYNIYERKILSQSSRTFYRKLIGEIYDNVQSIPTTLTEDEKLHFIVGFEHQTNALFKKNTGDNNDN